MGSKITDLMKSKEISISELKGKTLAVDGFNTLYMFLTTIRGPDGSPLIDSQGRITSHVQGLLSRLLNYLEEGIKLVFVFDGKSPDLKSEETQRRKELKDKARSLYQQAKEEKDIENMKKYAARTTFLTNDMVEETKEFLDYLGIPWIQAPSEGEAQAAHLVKKGEAYAVVSQDADSLLNQAPRLIKNLSIGSRRKLPGKQGYAEIHPELIELNENLQRLKLTQDQLIYLAILIGTDYNYGGVKGIGPKKGIKLIREHKPKEAFEKVKWQEHSDISWEKIYDVIKNMKVTDEYKIVFNKPNYSKIKEFLEQRDFSQNRIERYIQRFEKIESQNKQKGLGEFF